MIRAGTSERGRASAWRVLTAVLALYALVLTSLLGGISGVLAAANGDVICNAQVVPAGDATPGDPKPGPGHHQSCCCTAAALPMVLAAPSLAASPVVWPPRRVTRLVWRMDGLAAARAPPGSIASPRAPPVV